MTLTIPYEHSPVTIHTNCKGDLLIELNNHSALKENLFNQLLYSMSYDDIINTITPQSFENIMKHYKTNYKEE